MPKPNTVIARHLLRRHEYYLSEKEYFWNIPNKIKTPKEGNVYFTDTVYGRKRVYITGLFYAEDSAETHKKLLFRLPIQPVVVPTRILRGKSKANTDEAEAPSSAE